MAALTGRGGEARCAHHHHEADASTLIRSAGIQQMRYIWPDEIRSSQACFGCLCFAG